MHAIMREGSLLLWDGGDVCCRGIVISCGDKMIEVFWDIPSREFYTFEQIKRWMFNERLRVEVF